MVLQIADNIPGSQENLEFKGLKSNSILSYSRYVQKKIQVIDWLKSSLLMAFLFFVGAPLLISAVYPPAPTQFADNAGSIKVATDEREHAMVAYTALNGFVGQGINTYYFKDNVWNFMPLNSAIGNLTGLVMDPSGLALLTFREDGTDDLRSFYFDGTMWNAPLSDPLSTAISGSSTGLAINKSGLGVAAWSDSTQNIRVSFFSNSNWSVPSLVGVIGTGSSPKVAINSSGDLAVAWEDLTGAVVVRHFIGGVWSSPTTINPLAVLSGVGISDNGKSLVAIRDSGTLDVYAGYFIGSTLSSTTLLNPPQLFGPANFGVSLEMAPNGTAVAAWQYEQTFFNQYDLYYAQFDGNTWAQAVDFQTGISGTEPAVSLNSKGDGLIMWGNNFGFPNPLNFLTAQLPVGGVLTQEQVVRTSTLSVPRGPAVSLADNGFNALAWLEANPSFDVDIPFGMASVVVQAPTELNGKVCKNHFASQTDRVNIITWQPSTDINVVRYDLKRNGVLIANIPAVGPLVYNDHNRCKNQDVYTLTAIARNGAESLPISITVN